MAAKILCRSLELEPLPGFVLFVLKEIPYPAHVLSVFGVILIMIFLRFRI